MLRLLKWFIVLSLFGLFALVVAVGFLYIVSGGNISDYVQKSLLRLTLASRAEELNTPYGTDDTPIRFTVQSGDTAARIARNLADSALIRDAALFVDYLRAEGIDTQIQAGIYFLSQNQTIPEIAHALLDARNSSITFRVLAGTRSEEVAQAIDATRKFAFKGADFLALVQAGAPVDPVFAALVGLPAGASLEGFLFPDTYILPPNITAQELRDQLLAAFLSAVGNQLITDINAQGYSMRDAVTLASIIEREAVWADEHPLIASVYRNRLAIDMLLQADPTVQYALNGARGTWWPNITQSDYRGVQSPYNTYLYKGLPPSPIANPSLSAIRAAIYPAQTSYYYFRARCDRSNYHNFATTYEQHLANGC